MRARIDGADGTPAGETTFGYNLLQATFDEVGHRYDRESDFRMTVDRYIGEFADYRREQLENGKFDFVRDSAGRNLAVLVEAAVRNEILKLRGIDSMAEFLARQKRELEGGD